MDAGPSELHEVPYERLFPWVRLFRAFGVATDAKKLLLAVAGLILLFLGWSGIDSLFPRGEPIHPPWAMSPENRVAEPVPTSFAASLGSAPWRLAEPVRALAGPFLACFRPEGTGTAFLHALVTAIWGVAVWGLIGGAIARIAVVQVARGERVGTVAALRFALRKGLTLVGAPLIPLLGVAFLTALCALFGLIYRIPGAGPLVAGVFAFLPLLAGLVMAIILILLALGWPLMPATVAAEGEDGFDAISRSFAYVNQRRGHYLGYAVLAGLIGVAGLVLVDLVARLVLQLTQWALSFGAPQGLLEVLYGPSGNSARSAAATVHSAWLSLVGLIAHGWIYSYFWSSAAIIYLLLRQSVDGTPLYEVHRIEAEAAPLPIPVET